jgi:hypothetical protein
MGTPPKQYPIDDPVDPLIGADALHPDADHGFRRHRPGRFANDLCQVRPFQNSLERDTVNNRVEIDAIEHRTDKRRDERGEKLSGLLLAVGTIQSSAFSYFSQPRFGPVARV